MFRLAIFLLCVFFNHALLAITYTSVQNGDWNDPSTWDANGRPGTFWSAADEVNVNHVLVLNQNIGFSGDLTISGGASLIGLNRNIQLNNGATITALGEVGCRDLTLNSASDGIFSSTLTVNGNLSIGSNSTFISNDDVIVNSSMTNNGGLVTTNATLTVSQDLINNNGTITFNSSVDIGRDLRNNNGSAEINVNDDLTVGRDFQNNSGASINIDSAATFSVDRDITNNSGSTIESDGVINGGRDFDNNGGSVTNSGDLFLGRDLTQNGGTFTNDGVSIVEGELRINGGGTYDGSGILRVDQVTNFGTFSGSVDLCSTDDASATTLSGGGVYSATTTYCEESASAALPIELTYFRVENLGGSLLFSWQTKSESNNNYFEVQQSLAGKKDFKTILKVNGAGNSNRSIDYEQNYLDFNGLEAYFRLKQTDFDGKATFSQVVFMTTRNAQQAAMEISVYPNPTSGDDLKVSLNYVEEGFYTIELFNISGKTLNSKEIVINSESIIQHSINIQNLAPGIYFIRLVGEENTKTLKVVVN